jgi:hypothetical protein
LHPSNYSITVNVCKRISHLLYLPYIKKKESRISWHENRGQEIPKGSTSHLDECPTDPERDESQLATLFAPAPGPWTAARTARAPRESSIPGVHWTLPTCSHWIPRVHITRAQVTRPVEPPEPDSRSVRCSLHNNRKGRCREENEEEAMAASAKGRVVPLLAVAAALAAVLLYRAPFSKVRLRDSPSTAS